MLKRGLVHCTRCGKQWYGPLCGVKYCESCKKIVAAERSKKMVEKKEAEARGNNRVLEITRLADAEGLSYGKYCLKYGI